MSIHEGLSPSAAPRPSTAVRGGLRRFVAHPKVSARAGEPARALVMDSKRSDRRDGQKKRTEETNRWTGRTGKDSIAGERAPPRIERGRPDPVRVAARVDACGPSCHRDEVRIATAPQGRSRSQQNVKKPKTQARGSARYHTVRGCAARCTRFPHRTAMKSQRAPGLAWLAPSPSPGSSVGCLVGWCLDRSAEGACSGRERSRRPAMRLVGVRRACRVVGWS